MRKETEQKEGQEQDASSGEGDEGSEEDDEDSENADEDNEGVDEDSEEEDEDSWGKGGGERDSVHCCFFAAMIVCFIACKWRPVDVSRASKTRGRNVL